MYQMIEADREAQRAAQGTTAQGAAQGAEVPESAGSGPEAQDGQIVRETVFVVPGPAIWRIRGTLTVAKGMIALEDDDGVLWYLPGLDRYIGFIDGLDAGEQAALEGYAPPRGSSQERYFQPIRLFIDEMEYDLAVPPEGVYLGGQTTIIREIERPAAPSVPPAPPPAAENQEAGDRRSPAGTDPWWDSPASVWQHNHTSPWAPPASILDFTMDYDSFWREDPAKQERRDRDSREIWY
jgi:hypothetical protein